MSRAKPARVRYYVDADLLGLAKQLVRLRPDVTYPGDPGGTIHARTRPACSVTKPATLDELWIPETALQEWLVISRDRKIQVRPAELSAVRDSGARMVALAGDDAGSTWRQLEVVMTQWRAIEKLRDRPGPFIVITSRTSMRELDIDAALARMRRPTRPRA